MNIVEVIRESTRHEGHGLAVLDETERLTYRDLVAQIDGIAAELRSLGLASPGPVGLVCEDSVEYILVSLAVLSIGAAIVPIPPHPRGEIDRILEEIDPAVVLCESGAAPFEDGTRLASLAGRKRELRLHARPRVKAAPPAYGEIGPAFIRFSSGTTDRSKGIVLSHRTILERTEAANAGLRITREDRVMCVLSMNFHFVVSILLFLRSGATIVLCGRGFPASLAAALTAHEPTVLYASPFHFHMMTIADAFAADALRRTRLAVCTSASLPSADARNFRHKFGVPVAEAYGIIEVGLPCLNDSGDPAKEGSVGRPLPAYELRLANVDGDGVGEIRIKGPGLLDAYYSPWRSRDEILEDGWFATGDLGRVDDDGFLRLHGRRTNVINFSGMKVFPEEVESALNRCPGVTDAFVYARPHEEYGELPCADVILDAGSTTSPSQIRRYCYRHLASYKVPKEIHVVTEISRTSSGKIRRWPGATS